MVFGRIMYHGRAFTLDVVSNFISAGRLFHLFRVAVYSTFSGWPCPPVPPIQCYESVEVAAAAVRNIGRGG